MASNSTAMLLPGQTAPLTVITATDQSGVIIIATALALTFALISILLRLFIRKDFQHRFEKDDLLAIISIVRTDFEMAPVDTNLAGTLRFPVGDSFHSSIKGIWENSGRNPSREADKSTKGIPLFEYLDLSMMS